MARVHQQSDGVISQKMKQNRIIKKDLINTKLER